MRVLLLLATDTDDAPLAGTLTSALEKVGVAVATTREVNPDLSGYDLAHIIATSPIEHTIRQGIHVRRWGCPLIITPSSGSAAKEAEIRVDPPERYEEALWGLLAHSAERVLIFDDGENTTATQGYVAVPALQVGSSGFGDALIDCYRSALEGYAAMIGQDGGTSAARWIPTLSAEAYGQHLEDLVQLQLELIAYRDAEYEQLRHRFDAAQQIPHDQELATEYDRLKAWSQDLAARHETLQADYARMQRWSGELESQLRVAARGGRLARIASLLLRR